MKVSTFLLWVRGFLSTIWVLGFCKGLEKRNYAGTWRKLENSSELCLLYRNFFVQRHLESIKLTLIWDHIEGTLPSSQLWHQRNLLSPLISPSPSWFPISESLKLALFSLSFLKEPPSTIEDARKNQPPKAFLHVRFPCGFSCLMSISCVNLLLFCNLSSVIISNLN